ncbi:MAG: hypothetical protein ACRC35_12650 [Angustibacter sp.]
MAGDLVLFGGTVFDGVEVVTGATAVAARAGRVIAVGSDRQVRETVGPLSAGAHVLDLGGRLVVPGFVDVVVWWSPGSSTRTSTR